MIYSLNSIFVVLNCLCNLLHPVHVSITNIDYYDEQKRIEVSIKIFKDDFQMLFAHLYQLDIEIENIEYDNEIQHMINTYFSNHFKLNVDGNKQRIQSMGFKKNDESIWFFYGVSLETKPNSFEFVNTILLDLYYDQKNMLIFSYNKIEKGFMFNLKQRNYKISLDDF